MPRLFVALPLPPAVRRSLEPLARGLGDVRWLTPDQQHLTLRFLGDIDNGRLNDVAEALALVHGWPFELRLKGLGHFPPRGEPRVLWVGVREERRSRQPQAADRPGAEAGRAATRESQVRPARHPRPNPLAAFARSSRPPT